MNNTLRIEKYQSGQEKEIHQLIKRVYDEFVAPDYTDEGNRLFYQWIESDMIAERQRDEINLWVTLDDSEKIVGIIEIRDNKNITLLFVDKAWQGQGIAKRLFTTALSEIIRRIPALRKLAVHASPCSVQAYKKLGFNETGEMQEESGIKYLPMEMDINT
jgi:predicted GNAT family N-acyltransferase